MLVQMQWQLIPETTMHAFDINALLTMIAINKLMDRTGADQKWPETDTHFFSQCKNNQCGSENTHVAVPEKLTINFFWPNRSFFLVVNTSTTIEFRIRFVTFDNIYYRFLCKKRFNREFDLFWSLWKILCPSCS